MQATRACILASRPRGLGVYVLLLACALPSGVWAQGAQAAEPAQVQGEQVQDAQPEPEWEGAVGLQLSNAPEYAGSDQRKFSVKPGLYLRWGRFAIATGGNFVTRQNNDEIVRGLSANLVQGEDLRARVGLRYDQGRKASDSGELAQLDEVRATLRARLSVVWEPVRDWRLGAGLSSDILGRDGGTAVDFGVGRDFRPNQRTFVSIGTSVSWGDERFMQTRFGISPEAAERSGKPAYDPGAGLRDVALTAQWRTDIDRSWTVWVSGGVSRLLGPAADSPLTLQAGQAVVGVGASWRF